MWTASTRLATAPALCNTVVKMHISSTLSAHAAHQHLRRHARCNTLERLSRRERVHHTCAHPEHPLDALRDVCALSCGGIGEMIAEP